MPSLKKNGNYNVFYESWRQTRWGNACQPKKAVILRSGQFTSCLQRVSLSTIRLKTNNNALLRFGKNKSAQGAVSKVISISQVGLMSSLKTQTNLRQLTLPVMAAVIFVLSLDVLALTEIEFSGWTEVAIENPDYTGEPESNEYLGTAVLSIFGDLTFDEMAVETSPNNFSGAAFNVSLILDLNEWIPDGQPEPPAFFLPYFANFQNNPEYINGDVFVGNDGGSEFFVGFPVFNGPALSNEPFDFLLKANSELSGREFTTGNERPSKRTRSIGII